MKRNILATIILLALAITGMQPSHAESVLEPFHLTSDNGLPDNNIQHICQDSLGYIYFFGRYNTFRYDGYTFKTLTAEETEQVKTLKQTRGNLPNSTFFDNKGNEMRLLATGDLEYKDIKTDRTYVFNVCSPRLFQLTQRVKCTVITDRRGLIWVSTNGSGLRMYNPRTDKLQTITRHHPDRIISSDHIIWMMEDRDGNIWLSGEHHGVTCLKVSERNYDIINIRTADAEKGNQVRMLRRLDDDRILLADMNGVVSVSHDELKTFQVLPTNGLNYISSCLDSNGELWLGSRSDGIFVDGRHYGSGRIDCIMKDSKGRMWICGLGGSLKLASLSDGNYTELSFMNHIEDLDPRMMIQDHRSNIWLATKQGLYVFHPDSIIANPANYQKIIDGRVMCVYESSDQRLWAGTSGKGLYYFDNVQEAPFTAQSISYISLTAKDGLTSNIVQFITEDKNRNIYVGTENGLTTLNLTTPQPHNLTNHYFKDNRLHNIFIEQSFVSLHDGRMAFGSHDGIVVIEAIKPVKKQNNKLLITDIEVNGVKLAASDGIVWSDKEIRLEHHQNSLTFNFSNLDFGQQQQTVYQCLLEGYDKEWIDLGNLHFTTYKQLSPGHYTLRVNSRSLDDSIADSECSFDILISPPWWATWWGYLIYTSIILLVGYIIYRQLHRISKLRQAVAVEKQLTDYKLKFFTNISHEFRTPLTLIQGSMDKLRQLPNSPSSARVPLDVMQRNVNRMLRLINQLLEFRRMQNNKLSLSLEEVDIVAFVHNLCQGFHDAAEQKRIALSFLPSMKKYNMFIDCGFIDKAVYNLLSNAFKYTPTNGSITVRIKVDESTKIAIIVEDTGIGVPEEKREKIFDRFSRGQIGRDSLGIGLDLTAELIRTHKGSIRCDANAGGGSIFTILLPTDKSIYDESDFLVQHSLLPKEETIIKEGFADKMSEIISQPMNSHRILIVEDDSDVAVYLKQELGRYFIVETAFDGGEALSLINDSNNSFDLVITDAMMPDVNGFELLRSLRKNETTRHLPVIMLTALTDDSQRLKGLTVGADAYITKPFSLSLLLVQCRNLLQRTDHIKNIITKTDTGKAANLNTIPDIITSEREHKLLSQLAFWVDSHLASPELSVDKFAEDMGYGRTTFYNKLKSLTGMTPNEYIKERRLLKAYELLSDVHITVAEVSYQVGMATPQYLSTIFKKRFGVSPTQFQKGVKE